MASDAFGVDRLPCPKCGISDTRVLTFSTAATYWHWYLRCADCGHVWTIPKERLPPLADSSR